MKRIVFITLLMVAAFVACDDNEDFVQKYYSVGSIEMLDDLNIDFNVNLDNGTTITPIINYDDNEVEDGDRVIVEYSIAEELSDDSLNVNIFYIEDILTKEIIQLTELIRDSIGNDPIHTSDDDIWISEKHLNIVFDYLGYDKTHLINLVRPIGEDTHDDEGRLILEFKHNADDDLSSVLMTGIVSFEMDNLRIADEESVDFVVRVKGYDDEDYEFEGTYEFASENQPSMLSIPKNKLMKLKNSKNN